MHDEHISADVQRITLNVACVTISGGRTEQLDILCRVTGFTSDFLSFIVVEHIWFFHGALQLCYCVIQYCIFTIVSLQGYCHHKQSTNQHLSTSQQYTHSINA